MSSGFISEVEIAEKRKVRQAEWERVRLPHQPLEAPEEEYDRRSLFERLDEQKKKRELEYEETHRLKNMIKGLDDDEVEFLDLVDRSKFQEEKKKAEEELRELADFRTKVAHFQEKSLEQRINQEIRQPLKVNNVKSSGKTSQSKLLAGAVIKKRPSENTVDSAKENTNKRAKPDSDDNINEDQQATTDSEAKQPNVMKNGVLTCIGILPGVGNYDISSDESDYSSDEVIEKGRFDLLGRRMKKKRTGFFKRKYDSSSDESSVPNGSSDSDSS